MKKDINEIFYDALIRHQIYLLRFSSGVSKKIIDILNKTENQLSQKIIERLKDKTGLTSPDEVRKMETLVKIINKIRTTAWENATNVWVSELKNIAIEEQKSIDTIVTSVSPVVINTVVPSAQLLRNIVSTGVFEGRILKSWAKNLMQEDLRRIENSIRVGMASGESSLEISRRVVGTARLSGSDGITQITRDQASSITRTAINYITNEARSEYFKNNYWLFKKEQFVATLDSRTTAVCRANDGKVFDIGKGPRPPLHWNCRSIRVPVLDRDILSVRPSKPVTERMLVAEFSKLNNLSAKTREELPRGTLQAYDTFARKRTRELIGQVPGSLSYQDWLKRQSVEFQDEVLGKTKAKLFRDGGLALDKFINRNGNELTLQELKAKHQYAFNAAGIL